MKQFLTALFRCSLLVILCAFIWSPTFAAAKPNILFIVVDDLNDWVGSMGGHPQARTPNMDRLAARGMLFSNAHVQAPICNASRISVLTGLRPSTTGIYGLSPSHRKADTTREVVTLPQYFAQHGYHTAGFGKVFHHNSPTDRKLVKEFDHWGITPLPKLPAKKFVNTPDPEPWMDWGVFPENDSDQADWRVADAAITTMRNRPADKPFFLAVGFLLPHVPCYVSQKWFDLFPPMEQIKLPPYLADDRADVPDFAWKLHWKIPEPRTSWLQQSGEWKPLIRSYLASTAFVDAQIGRLLDALDAQSLSTNSVVVLWSDNGWHLGEKGITGKLSLWERSTRVPLIFAGPGVAKSSPCSQPVELLDIFPTLVDLCGLPAKAGLEGHSLMPQLKDAHTPRSWPAIITQNAENHSVRSADWRYIRYADGAEELYNLRSDPNEWTNRVQSPNLAEVVREHAKWLPKQDHPVVPLSAGRILTRTNGAWAWEGKEIVPSELVK